MKKACIVRNWWQGAGHYGYPDRSLFMNLVKLVSKGWMLITAGGEDTFNTMTGGWGIRRFPEEYIPATVRKSKEF